MSVAPEILEKIDELVASWNLTEVAARVDSLESYCHVHGFPEFYGDSIPVVIQALLLSYTGWLIDNKELIERSSLEEEPAGQAELLQKFLDAEQKKIEKADELTAKLNSYRLGILDPRYHQTKAELKKVVDSFSIVDKNYNLNLPKI